MWVFFMLVQDPRFHETFSWLQLGGFILLVFGTFVYNEILVIPFWGLNVNTKEAILARKKELGEDSENKQLANDS